MAVSTVMTRRAVFKGVPSAIIASGAMIYTDARPALDVLFDAWKAEYHREVYGDTDLDAKCSALSDLEQSIIQAPAISVRDMCIKIAVADAFGDMDLSPIMSALAMQAWGALT